MILDLNIPTDSSGRWVASRDIPTIMESVVRTCVDIARTQGSETAALQILERFKIEEKQHDT